MPARPKPSLFDPRIVRPAVAESFRKLAPRRMVRNPVMFVVYVGSFVTTGLWLQALLGRGEAPAGFILAVALWTPSSRAGSRPSRGSATGSAGRRGT